MELERVSAPLEGWFSFIKGNFFELFKKLFRVQLYSTAAAVLAVLAILAGMAAVALAGGWLGWAAMGVCIVVAIILMLISILFGLASYKVIDEEHGAKQKVDILALAKRKAVPATTFLLIAAGIVIVALIPFLALGFALSLITGTAGIVSPLLQLGLWLVSIPVSFFLQFALFELVLADKGPVESLRTSFGLVKRNFWETLVFCIVRVMVGFIVSIPFTIALVVVLLVLVFTGAIGGLALAATGALAGGTGLLLLAAVVGVLLPLYLIYMLAYNAADETFVLSLTYRYWKTIRGDMKPDKKTQIPAATSGMDATAQTAATSGMPPSPGRAIIATRESPVMVVPAAGTLATIPPQAAKPAQKEAKMAQRQISQNLSAIGNPKGFTMQPKKPAQGKVQSKKPAAGKPPANKKSP